MQSRLLATTTIFAVATLAACSESTGPAAGRPLSLSFSTAPAAGATLSQSAAPGATRSVTVTSGTDELVITSVRVVVARMELQASGASCTSTAAAGDDKQDEHECDDLQVAPSVVELPVDGTVLTTASGTIPSGTYSALEARIRPIRSSADLGAGSAAFLKAHPELDGVSVVVQGTWNKTAFTYSGTPRAEFEKTFNPPITVDGTTKNLTVQVDLASWFKTSTGTLIDPATAAPGKANESVVAGNIRRSFRAFRDNDRKGHDDDAH
jgi:hypothetical protein